MDTTPKEPAPKRPGFIDTIKSYFANAIGTTRARVDDFSAEVEHRIFRVVSMVLWSLVAFASLTLGLIFAVLLVIFGLDLPPRYALGIPAGIFLVMGLVAVVMLRRVRGLRGPKSRR